jgi:phosphatidylethanolamine-binding protein (PEBP) family uncharacterized protein
MGRVFNATVSSVLLLVLGLAVAGCAGSSSETQPSSTRSTASASRTSSNPQTATSVTTPTAQTSEGSSKEPPELSLSSPAFKVGTPIPVQYTCDGADTSPPLSWQTIPKGTVELALFVVEPDGPEHGTEPPIFWAVGGLRPTLKGIAAGALPAGAIVGRNSLGQSRYTICPSKGVVTQYLIALYALRHTASPQPGFAAAPFLRKVSDSTPYEALTGFSYKRA